MPTFSLNHWDAVSGASGYNVHSGQVSGIWTHMTDVGLTTGPVTITVPWSGAGYAAVAAYDASHYEGLYSAPVAVTVGGVLPPTATVTLSVR